MDAPFLLHLDAAMNTRPSSHRLMLLATAWLCFSFSTTVLCQQVVTVDASGFTPDALAIDVGDSVLWVNLDTASPHSTTSDRPAGDLDHWDVTLNHLEIHTRTFVRSGTFTYHDTVGGATGTIIVNASAVPRLETPGVANGQFIFEVTGLTVGKTNVLEASTNLTSWLPLQTNTAASSSMNFSNAISPGRSFYRLIEVQ
jgi:plastocyanin